jgi:transcriptional regulator with XRE-family HTH domain
LRVRTLRLSRRMSQNDVGERLGITFQQVQKYENGANRIGAGRLQRIAEIFEVPISALFGAQRREGRAGVDPFEGLRTPGAVQLLEAYVRIGDRTIRRAFLRFAEQVAVTSQRSSRR